MKFADEPVGYYLERSQEVGAVVGRVVLENLMQKTAAVFVAIAAAARTSADAASFQWPTSLHIAAVDLYYDLGIADVDDEGCYEHETVVGTFDAATGDGQDTEEQKVVLSDLERQNLNHLMVCCSQ